MSKSTAARSSLFLGIALIGAPLIGACGDKDGDDTGSEPTEHEADDTSSGGDDTSSGGDDTSSGGDDTSSGGDDTSSGGDDTSSGGDDTSANSDDTGGGADSSPPGPCDGQTPGTGVGDCATDFTLVDQDGVSRSLYDYDGKVIVLDFSPFW